MVVIKQRRLTATAADFRRRRLGKVDVLVVFRLTNLWQVVHRCERPVLLHYSQRRYEIVIALGELLCRLDPRLQTTNQLKLVVDSVRLMVPVHVVLFSHFNELGQHVISLRAVLRKLVVWVALEHVGAGQQQLLNDFDKVAVASQVQSCPLVEAAVSI